jgi:hypothetical protein
MHGLKVRRHKVGITAGHLQRGMPEHLLEMEHAAATPEIVHGECMPECVKRAAWRGESEVAAKYLHIPQDVSAA